MKRQKIDREEGSNCLGRLKKSLFRSVCAIATRVALCLLMQADDDLEEAAERASIRRYMANLPDLLDNRRQVFIQAGI